jgi:hypothetical protein
MVSRWGGGVSFNSWEKETPFAPGAGDFAARAGNIRAGAFHLISSVIPPHSTIEELVQLAHFYEETSR